jgi:hypothetical protein
MLVSGFATLNAQTYRNATAEETVSGPARAESATNVIYADPYTFEYAEMTVENDQLHFVNLPSFAMTMHITDANGNELATRKISRKNNIVNVSKLKKGIHFVTLTADNSYSRKAFTLNRD